MEVTLTIFWSIFLIAVAFAIAVAILVIWWRAMKKEIKKRR